MAQRAGPYGLRVVKLLGDLPFSGGMRTYPLSANNPSAFFFGDPLGLNGSGDPVALSTTSPVPPATYAAAAVGNNPIGVCMGVSYQDPTYGFVNRQYLPANATGLGYKDIQIKIFDSPLAVMQIQATGSVTLDKVGKNIGFLVSSYANGTPSIGNSVVAADVSTLGAAAQALRIYDFVRTASPSPGMSSAPGDAFTDLLVIWCPGVHRHQIQTSF